MIALLPSEKRQNLLSTLTDAECEQLLYDWRFWARPKQLPPDGDWLVWLIRTGRGWGKTRVGAETVRAWVESGQYKRIGLIAPTAGDVRDVMVEGQSGLLSVSPPWNRPQYEPSKRRLTWPNGAIAITYSADEPDRLRGPQHDALWADELASWRYPETWDMAMLGLRLGTSPRAIVTTTPRPIKLIKRLMKDKRTHDTKGSTLENLDNLAPTFREQVLAQYEGTRLGRQELDGEILDDVPGALWHSGLIEQYRIHQVPENLARIVVAVDPAVTSGDDSDDTGIIVVALDANRNGRGYVLSDITIHGTPSEWAKRAVGAYHYWGADGIVAEANNGGELVRLNIQVEARNVPVKLVHASRGKRTRAEPISALYEQGRISHVGLFPELEDEMCSWLPGDDSPDRMDALVWGFTELMLDKREAPQQRPFLR